MDTNNNEKNMKNKTISQDKLKRLSVGPGGKIVTGGVLILLLVVTFIQLLEVSRLKGYVEAAQIDNVANQPIKPAISAPVENKSNDLPAQVGGC